MTAYAHMNARSRALFTVLQTPNANTHTTRPVEQQAFLRPGRPGGPLPQDESPVDRLIRQGSLEACRRLVF